jgi:hypothetical protein
MIRRRDFVRLVGLGALGLAIPSYTIPVKENPQKRIDKKNFSKLPSSDYINVLHKPIKWESASDGLDFSRTEVFRNNELVDVIATVKINPKINKIRVFNGNNGRGTESRSIESWQEKTGALAMINAAQYMSDPHLYPCALVICDGEQKGPKYNKYSRGMLLAEPKDLEGKLKKADLLDFDYDSFDYKTTLYTQGVQHWPILLGREGKIKVKETDWQANRTVVSKTKEDEILFMTTEGGYFTLYNFGRFLKDSNERTDKGFNVHTAMNMDGGYEAEMIVNTPNLSYLTYGEFESQGILKNMTVFDVRLNIPGVIGVFPRN